MAGNKPEVTNKKLFELMVSILEENPAVAKGLKFAEGREQFNEVWNEITASLNSTGPPSRKTPKWQKVWSDLKLKVKKKLQHNETEVNATGGGPNRLAVFSAYEEAVVNLLSLNKTTNHEGPSFGLTPHPAPRLTSTNDIHSDLLDEEVIEEELGENVDEPAFATPVTPARTPVTRRRQTPRNCRQTLLELQTDYLREQADNIGRASKSNENPFSFKLKSSSSRKSIWED